MWQFMELTTGLPGLPFLCIFGSNLNRGVLGSLVFRASAVLEEISFSFLNLSIASLTSFLCVFVGCDGSSL